MGNVGKPSHRPAGKARSDEEHRRTNRAPRGDLAPPTEAELEDLQRAKLQERRGEPVDRRPPLTGGERPGVDSALSRARKGEEEG